MATIIPLNTTDPANSPIEAGWLLVYTALWQHDTLPKQETGYARQIIRQTLKEGATPKQAFTRYCERILLANRLLQADPSGWIDIPSIWFHPGFIEGFAGTLHLYQQVAAKRQATPGYQQGIRVFAETYWQYIHEPAPAILKRCRKRLLRLKEYGLLQIWNNTIMLYQTL